MCTHLHPDHVGWNTQLIDGRWVPTFPNAKYLIARQEYEDRKQEATETTFVAARNMFLDSVEPIFAAGAAVLVEGSHDILDWFTIRPAPGHTPGHVRFDVKSGQDKAVFAGDAIHSPLQIPIWNWSTKYCIDHRLANETRRELLEFCESENALLIPAHFESPHVARIRESGGTFLPEFGW